jgi:hypothetical protein
MRNKPPNGTIEVLGTPVAGESFQIRLTAWNDELVTEVSYDIDGSQVALFIPNLQTWSFIETVSPLSEGIHVITMYVEDSKGIVKAISIDVDVQAGVIVDNVPPVLNVTVTQ